jgi:di/tricarboxylate transporter
MLGIMYVTGFLSLWIQNTAAASMMLPIVIALVKQLSKYNKAYAEPSQMERAVNVSGISGGGQVNMGFTAVNETQFANTENKNG